MCSSSDGLSPDGSTLTFGYDSETEEISPLRTFRSARSSPGRIFRTCRLLPNRTQAFEHEERAGVVCSIANNNPPKSKLSSLFDFSLVDSPQTAPQCRARRPLRSKLQIVATADLRQILPNIGGLKHTKPQARDRCRLRTLPWFFLPNSPPLPPLPPIVIRPRITPIKVCFPSPRDDGSHRNVLNEYCGGRLCAMPIPTRQHHRRAGLGTRLPTCPKFLASSPRQNPHLPPSTAVPRSLSPCRDIG